MRKTLSLAVLVCLGGVSVARAGDLNPNTQSGVAIDQAFAAGGVDHINLFNGSLTVAIPLGQPFRVGDHLSYGFTVVYGSNPWSVQPNGDSIPSPCANIALGWRLTFGQIIPSNFNGQTCGAPPSPTEVYEGPDGSAHQFFTALHEGDVAIPGVLYTRDGSYLRLLYLNPGYQLEFPDGTFHTFDAAGRIQTMQDRFGNSVTITMAPTVWTITDSYHRTATVFFVTTQTGVITVNLPAFGGATATYTLTTTAGNLWPSCPSSSPSHSFPVQLLTQIQFPDQSSYSIGAGDYIQTPPVSPAVCTPFSASLLGLNLRTGGRVEWQYATYSFPTEPFAKLHAGRTSNPGVTRRTLKDRNGTLTDPLCVGPPINGVPSCYWTYVQAAFSGAPMETITTVTDPYGSSTRNYFSVAFDTLSGGDPAAYGAPISQASHPQAPPQVVGGVTEYLSTESQDRSGAVVRREYLAFDHDALSTAALADSVGTAAANANRRIQQGRTVFVDDAGRYRDTIFTNFDQLGHYRVVKMSDNFGFGTQRTETTGWSPGGQPAANQSWILNTYAFTEQQEGDAVEHQEPVFEVATGFLLCTRRFKSGAQRGIHDVVVSYAHSDTTALGQVSSENWYGGDTRRISTTSNCPTGTDTPAYTYNHSYTVGVRMLTSVQVDDGTGTNHYNQLNLLDLTIDPSTGLPSSSRDPAGRPTSFTYDLLGRRVTVSPQGDATATTVYNINDPTSPFVDSVVGSGTPLEHRTWRLDALGRTARHEVTLPGGVVSNTFSSSNPMGWRTFVSESTSAAGGPGSTYLYYNPSDPRGVVPDPFGRPAEVDAADGKKTQFGYLGARVLTRSNRVQQQLQVPDAQGHPVWKTAEVWATNEETYDGLGRLRQIKDPNGTLTRYYYDVGGRLGTVISGGQTRSFNYDGRGFLIAERHPESGLTSYRYDARGNVVQESTATGSLFSSYDAASRLRVVSTVGGAVLKEFTYGTPNYYNGKLVSARASNYRSTGACTAYVVQQDLRYDPSHGRLSSEDTTLFQGATLLQKWTQSYVYDGAGRITQTNLPNCVANCTSTPRTVTTNYAFGRPTSIPGFASSITYNGNGTLNTVAHANGVVFTEAPDPSGMARPGSIGVAGSSSPWQPETYAYDGAGNVKQIGNKQYTYDAASRITSATLPSAAPLAPPLGSAPYQELTYDPLGNVTRISRGTQKGSILTYVDYSTDVASNHLQGASYDGSGSMTGYQGSVYTWDVLRQATTV
ncbi:MAG TPA: hypothetical protein VHR45_05945, partial [Thermoanaerobaculia bacterium]|nr:hypothetical protein [Thermoanaerobaculia bacterium]